MAVSRVIDHTPKGYMCTDPAAEQSDIYPGRDVGVDPGIKNLVTMSDINRVTLRYTSKQRLFESKYREVFEHETLNLLVY